MNTSLPLISVIINNYNNPRFIEKAILSVTNQTYVNLQIIIQDDCSTDAKIKAIYEKFLAYDKRIEVHYNEKNSQLFTSRMNAINFVKGQYVCFLDGDDYYDLDFIRHMYNYMQYKQCDIAVCNFAYVIENMTLVEKKNKFLHDEYHAPNLLNFMFEPGGVSFSQNLMWNKLYKADLIIKAQQTIIKLGLTKLRIFAAEDVLFNCFILQNASKICIDEWFIGNYYRRTNSLELMSLTKKINYLQSSNQTYQIIFDQFFAWKEDLLHDETFNYFKQTVINTFSQYLQLFQIGIENLQLAVIAKYLNIVITNENLQQLKNDILNVNNEWLITKNFKFKNMVDTYKKKILKGNDISFSLPNSIFASPYLSNSKIIDLNEQYYFFNYEWYSLLNFSLNYHKEVNIAYDEHNPYHTVLMDRLTKLIKQDKISQQKLVFKSVGTAPLHSFNLIIDQLIISSHNASYIWNNSLIHLFFKKLVNKDQELLKKVRQLFAIALFVSKQNLNYLDKSIFNYNYTLFYLLFIALKVYFSQFQPLKSIQTNNMKEIMLHVYLNPKIVINNPHFSFFNQIAKEQAILLINIIKQYYQELLDENLANFLFNAFFDHLAYWYESTTVIPNQMTFKFFSGQKKIDLYQIWSKQTSPYFKFHNYQSNIYKIPGIKHLGYLLSDANIFTNEMYLILRNHHSIFKLFWNLNKQRIKKYQF